MAKKKTIKWVTGKQVRPAREAAALTQDKSAALIYTAINNWRNWEQERCEMPPAFFELYLLKTGQFTLKVLPGKPALPAAGAQAAADAVPPMMRFTLKNGRVLDVPVKDSVIEELAGSR